MIYFTRHFVGALKAAASVFLLINLIAGLSTLLILADQSLISYSKLLGAHIVGVLILTSMGIFVAVGIVAINGLDE